MKKNGSTRPGERRTQVPSHEPMPGVDDRPIDVGATSGAQLPSKFDQTPAEKPGLNPNQDDVLTPFWPKK